MKSGAVAGRPIGAGRYRAADRPGRAQSLTEAPAPSEPRRILSFEMAVLVKTTGRHTPSRWC